MSVLTILVIYYLLIQMFFEQVEFMTVLSRRGFAYLLSQL